MSRINWISLLFVTKKPSCTQRSVITSYSIHYTKLYDWKVLIDGPHTYVFNVRRDLSERNDLAKWRQDIAQELRPKLIAWEESVDADAAARSAPAGE